MIKPVTVCISVNLMSLIGDGRIESAWYRSLPGQMKCNPDVTRRLLTLPTPENGATWCNFLRGMVEEGDKQSTSDPSVFRVKLGQSLEEDFGIEELNTICFDMGWDHEKFPGTRQDGHSPRDRCLRGNVFRVFPSS